MPRALLYGIPASLRYENKESFKPKAKEVKSHSLYRTNRKPQVCSRAGRHCTCRDSTRTHQGTAKRRAHGPQLRMPPVPTRA